MTLEHKVAVLPQAPTEVTQEEIDKDGLFGEVLKNNPNIYRDRQHARGKRWREVVRAFEEQPDDFCNAWRYLNCHPLFWYFGGTRHRPMPFHEKYIETERGMVEALEISVMKVDLETCRVSDDESKNTKTEVWYEICIVSSWPSQCDAVRTHAWQIDGGGDTYEEAVIKAARQVHDAYGNDRRIFDEERETHGPE